MNQWYPAGRVVFPPELVGIPDCPALLVNAVTETTATLEIDATPYWWDEYTLPLGIRWNHTALRGWTVTVHETRRVNGKWEARIEVSPPCRESAESKG